MDILVLKAYARDTLLGRKVGPYEGSYDKKLFVVEVVKCRDAVQEYAIKISPITTAPSSASNYAHYSNFPSRKTESPPKVQPAVLYS